MFIIFSRWKDKYKSCYICCRGKVKTTIANTPGKPLFIKRYFAFIPFLHRHPADSLFYPLIQTQLPKRIFLARRFFCRITRSHHLIYSDGFVEGWICLFPNLRVSPIFRFISTIDNGIKSWVMFSAFQNVLCLLVNFIADWICVCAGCGNQEIQRLHSGITGAFGHNIKELSVRLRVKFIEHNTVNVKAMLGIGFCRKHLIKAVGRDVHDTLLWGQDFHSFGKGRAHSYHIGSHIKYNGSLLAVSGTAIDFGTFFAVTAGKQQGNRSGKLWFAIFLRNFNVSRVKLTIAIRFLNAKQITDNLFLPVQKFKFFSSPCAFGMAQTLNKRNGIVCLLFVVLGILRHKTCWFKSCHCSHPPNKKDLPKSKSASFILTPSWGRFLIEILFPL